MAGSSASDLVWRAHVPAFLSHPWRVARNDTVGADQRLRASLALADQLIRYLAVVVELSARAAARSPGRQWTALCGKLDRPSLGDWLQVLHEARLSGAEDTPCGEVVRALRVPGAADRLERWVRLRNELAHQVDGAVGLDPVAAEARLPEVRALLRLTLDDWRILEDLPLCWVARARSDPSGRRMMEVVLASGSSDPLTMSLAGSLAERVPYIVDRSGHAVRLDPFLLVLPGRDGLSVVGLLHRARGDRALWSVAEIGPGLELPWAGFDPGAPRLLEQVAATDSIRLVTRMRDLVPELPGMTLVERLGGGGSGVVWRARLEGGQEVAVKVLHPDLARDDAQRRRLRREFEVMRALRVPGVAEVWELQEGDPSPYLVMGLVRGRDLRRRLDAGEVGVDQGVAWVLELLQTLAAVHAAGVVHRDVKPANVLIDEEGRVVLVDFGIARVGEQATRTLDILGTARYAAPEQRRGDPIDGRADLHAVGKLLEDLGEPSDALRAVIHRATADDPADRFASAGEMRSALEVARANTWAGGPLSPGMVLAGGFVVTAPAQAIDGSGLWLGLAIERSTGDTVSLLVGTGTEGATRLAAVIDSAASEARQAAGYRARLEDRGISFVVLHGGDGASVRRLVSGEVAKVERPGIDPRLAGAAAVGVGLGAAAVIGGVALGVQRVVGQRVLAQGILGLARAVSQRGGAGTGPSNDPKQGKK